MTNIINQWIRTRLGIIMNWNAETFCNNTRDGHLLSRMLRSYEIITEDQLEMIQRTDVRIECLRNFKYITKWLGTLGLKLTSGDVDEIVEYNGLGSINIFYKLFLELHEKDNISFITQQRLNEKLLPQDTRFVVKSVESIGPTVKVEGKYKSPWVECYDVIHWHQDRLEMLVNKCKAAREEYMGMVRTREKRLSSSFAFRFADPLTVHESTDTIGDGFDESVKSVDMTYNELIREQKRAKLLNQFAADPEEAKIILKKCKAKVNRKAENAIFQKQLHKEVLNSFWERIRDEEEDDCDNDTSEKLLKQSLYEKQMLRKLGEVKFQKDVMIQNKLAISDAISREKEAEFVNKFLEEDKELNEKEFQYYLTKEKTLRLHKKIHEEKLRLKKERCYKMCWEFINHMCDIAVEESEYKEFFGESPSKRVTDNWKKCLLVGESFEDAVSPIEVILKPEEEIPENLETIVHNEIERQDKLDEKDFESYLNFEWPWELENVDVDENCIQEMNYGMNILGRIVHSLLKSKYPLPEPPPPPALPKVKVSVCVNGMTEMGYLPLLQKILASKEIIVFDMQDVVNFCINAYKEETKPDLEDQVESETTQVKGKKAKAPKKGAKSKYVDEKADNRVETEIALADKKVQTPKVYPCEEMPLSAKAELGRIAEEELASGSSLTDHLLVHMFLEFLRPKQNIKGWVLINYPQTLEQAILLEESLTGTTVPGYSNTLRISRSIGELAELEITCEDATMDIYERCRKSKILNDPMKEKEDGLSFDSALTAFIRIIQTINENSEKSSETEKAEYPEDSTSPLDIFYSDMGCNYSLYFEHFDYYTVKSLGKLIIGDYTIPPKTSIELFGDSIRYIDAEKIDLETMFRSKSSRSVKKDDKKEPVRKEKVVIGKRAEEEKKTEVEIAGKKKGKAVKPEHGHVLIVHVDKFTQIPEVVIEEVEEEEISSVEPGGPGWEYVNLKLVDELQLALATLWENAEEVYIGDFGQVMFMKRMILNAVIPKVTYIKNHMNRCINSPDDKQMYLRKFQQIYNEFDADVRNDVEFKAELHCRVNDLREKLIGVCDDQMMEAEKERCRIIDKMWAPRQLVELINNYMNGFQLEIDRHVDTLSLVSDYYAGIITKLPIQEPMAKETLPRLDLLDSALEEAVCDVLHRVDEDVGDTFASVVEQIYEKATAFSNKCMSWASSCLEKVKLIFSPHVEKGKEKQAKKNKSDKRDKSPMKIIEPNYEVKKYSEKLFEEWKYALTGESARIMIRLKLLKYDMEQNLHQTLNTMKNNMRKIFEEIRSKYNLEVGTVNEVTNFLARAIEAGVPLQEEMIFKDGEFYLNPHNIFFPDVAAPEVPPIEISEDMKFTIVQLDHITDIFFDFAPSGYVPERIFVYLLQDIVMDQETSMAPKSWSNTIPEDIICLTNELFGNQELISWKDFIIYNFLVPFPSAEDILVLRKKYGVLDVESTELLSREQYESVCLWFEENEDGIRLNMIKSLIFKMYNVYNGRFNYTAMLFHFCKADCVPAAIAKALALSLGKLICWDKEIGDKFVKETLERRRIHEEEVRIRNEERRQNQELTQYILRDVVDEVIHECDSVIIEDLTQTDYEGTSKPSLQNTTDDGETRIPSLPKTTDVEIQMENDNETDQNAKPKQFSNIEIGFEECDNTGFSYFITLDHLTGVLVKTLPASLLEKKIDDECFSEKLGNIFEGCRNAEFNNEVLAHDILNNAKFLEMLSGCFSFQIKNPSKIIAEFIQRNEDTNV